MQLCILGLCACVVHDIYVYVLDFEIILFMPLGLENDPRESSCTSYIQRRHND